MQFVHRISDSIELLRMGAPLSPGPTGTLALVIDHAWRPETLFMQLACYIDESGTHADSPTMVLGGYVARLSQWRKFDAQWRFLLRRYDLTHFHSKDLWHRKKEFKGWTDAKALAFTQESIAISDRNTLFGFSVSMLKADFDTHYLADPRPKKFQMDSQYGVCFRTALVFAIEALRREYPSEMDRSLVHFIVEDGARGIGDVQRIVAQLRQHEPRNYGRFIGTATLGEKTRFPGLQLADSVASSSWKQMDLTELVALPPQVSVRATGRAVQAVPIFHVPLSGKALGMLRRGIHDFKEFRAKHWRRGQSDAQGRSS